MEAYQERVLAYTMAKEITNDELAAVSGGEAKQCLTMCGGGSAGSGQPSEVHVDVTWDL